MYLLKVLYLYNIPVLLDFTSNVFIGENMNSKILAIVAVVVIVAAGAGAAVVLMNNNGGNNNNSGGDAAPQKTGLYLLDAKVLDIDMGAMSGTPKVIDTVEYMYKSVYGDLTDTAKAKTITDAQADTTFWNTYCKYTKLATVDGEGKIHYKTATNTAGTDSVEKVMDGPATRLIATGSAYAFSQYYFLCAKYSVTPFSDEAKNNSALTAEFQSLNYAGLTKADIATSSPELAALYGADYKDRCSSIKTYDIEQMGTDILNARGASAPYNEVILMGSASIAKASNPTFVTTAESNGGHIMLMNAKDIPATFAMVDQIGVILGASEAQIDSVIQDLQLRLYKVYVSLGEKNAALSTPHKAYFEGSGGKASSSTSSGKSLCAFFGWDTTLFDGAEHDTEGLLVAAPDILMFYTNDDRSMDVKMRVTS